MGELVVPEGTVPEATEEWRYDRLQRKWTTKPEVVTPKTQPPPRVPTGTAYGDWPRCAWPNGCTIGVRDGGLCSPHQDLVLAYGHDPRPDPASKAQEAWKPCTVCGARVTWHRRLTDVEEAAAVVWLEDHPDYQLTPSSPSEQVMATHAAVAELDQAGTLAQPHAYVQNGAKPTAAAAAAKAKPGSGTQRGRVLRCIVDAGAEGVTDDQVRDRLGLELNTIRPRRLELVEAGYVIDSGDTRMTPSGNPAVVWLATLDGATAVEE